MLAKYVCVYAMQGANKLDGAREAPILEMAAPIVNAFLTENPEPHFLHIDRIATIIGRFTSGLVGKPQKEFVSDFEVRQRQRRIEMAGKVTGKVFLVVEGETKQFQDPTFKASTELEDFRVGLDGFRKQTVRDLFAPIVDGILMSLVLCLADQVDHQTVHLGEAVYFVDAFDKPLYPIEVHSHARLSLASALSTDAVKSAIDLAQGPINDPVLQRCSRTLVDSLNFWSDPLAAFLAAWAALEIFVNMSFRARYSAMWPIVAASAAPELSERVSRLAGRLPLLDKFWIIASVLNNADASNDHAKFSSLKSMRDGFLHGSIDLPKPIPFETIHELLIRYLKLHATRGQQS